MPALLLEVDKLMRETVAIARIHGYGYGKQPLVWPKAEQEWFAEFFPDRWWKAIEAIGRAYAELTRPPVPRPGE